MRRRPRPHPFGGRPRGAVPLAGCLAAVLTLLACTGQDTRPRAQPYTVPPAPSTAAPGTTTPGRLPDASLMIQVPADRQSGPVYSDDRDRDADLDDPAIWVPPAGAQPSSGFVAVTAKDGGLRVYDLSGRLVQDIPAVRGAGTQPGRYNNVDIAYQVLLGGVRRDLAVVSDPGADRLRIFAVQPGAGGPLHDVTAAGVPLAFSSNQATADDLQRTAYGLAASTDERGVGWVVASRREATDLALFRLVDAGGGRVGYQRVRSLALPTSFALPGGRPWSPCLDDGAGPQVEGLVFDRAQGAIWAAQEDVGIWQLPIALDRPGVLVDRVREFGRADTTGERDHDCEGAASPAAGRHLSADVEGLTLYTAANGTRYLLASSQGDSTFAVYDPATGRYLGGFAITPGPATDAVDSSDGSAVASAALAGFPQGVFVAHDGDAEPTDPDRGDATGIKLVAWPKIAGPLGLVIGPAPR